MPDIGSRVGAALGDNRWLNSIASTVDVLVLLVVFVAFAYITVPYGETGLFPLVFLVAGIAFLTIELLTQLLPGEYSAKARAVLNRDIGTVEPSEEDIPDAANTETERSLTRALYIVVAMGLLFAVTYVLNFFVATVAFSLATGWVFGLRDYRLVVVTLLLAGAVYGVFGEIIHTPIFE